MTHIGWLRRVLLATAMVMALGLAFGQGGVGTVLAQQDQVKVKVHEPAAAPDSLTSPDVLQAPGTGGPDGFGYTYKDSTQAGCPFNFSDISTTGTNVAAGDDACTAGVPIGFPFPFYGVNRTTIQIEANGYETFMACTFNFTNTCIPTTATPNAAVYPAWDDMLNAGGGGTGAVFWQSFAPGLCPGGRSGACFITQWNNVSHFNGFGPTTLEAILRDNGIIEYQFRTAPPAGWTPTTGIENDAGTIALQYSCNTQSDYSNSLAVYFLPPNQTQCNPFVASPFPAVANPFPKVNVRSPLGGFAGSVIPASVGGSPVVDGTGGSPTDEGGGTADSGSTASPGRLPILPNQVIIPTAGANDPCVNGLLDLTTSVQNVGAGPTATVIDRAFPELQYTHTGGVSIVSCNLSFLNGGSGTCSFTGSVLRVDMTLPGGATVTVNWTVAILITPKASPGLPNNVFTVDGCAIWDFNGNGVIDATESDCLNSTPPVQESLTTITINCLQAADPNRQLGCQIHLPILNFQGQDEVCDTWIEVQVIGCTAAKAVLVTWADPGFCPPQAAGPLKVECTGLLKPGSTWNMLMAQIPTGSKSGMLFKFTARQLAEIGIDLGFDDVVADVMCETLFFGIVGDADDYRRFKKAYNEGLEFAGIRQDLAMGDGFLAVDVHRSCPGDVTPTAKVTSLYNGIAGTHLGTYDPAFGGFGYYVPLMYADKGGMNSIMYIQNGGLECSSVEIWFKTQDDCLRAKICEVFTVAPGESFQFDATDCVGPDWQGSAWLRSTQPLGIAIDIVGRDVLMTYVAEPADVNYTYDPKGRLVSEGDQVAFGPLIYSEYQGWDTGIQVQNLSAVVNAKVKVYFLDRSGDIITTLVDWICPRGSQTFFLPVVSDLPGTWVGSVRIESQEWWTPGSPIVVPPNIVGVAQLIKYNDAARTQTQEAIAYGLLPEHKIYDWQIGSGGGGLESGVGMIAIPSLLKDIDGTGITSEVAIANVVPKPGFTDLAIFIYDQNGLLDYVCQKLNEKQVEYIDLQTWGYVNPGFKGSAIISATFWEHDVFGPTGNFIRNVLGLGAVQVQREKTRLGEDVPGDEAAGDRGIPFDLRQVRDARCQIVGNVAPLCPGQPNNRVIPNCPLGRFFAQSQDTPLPVTNTGGPIFSRMNVATQTGCLIQDLDVWVSYITNPMGSITDSSLVSPGNSPVTVKLFGPICGAAVGNVNAIFDDDASVIIGSAGTCIPDKFNRWLTNPNTAGNTMRAFEGLDPNGLWVLRTTSTSNANILMYWELQIDFQ